MTPPKITDKEAIIRLAQETGYFLYDMNEDLGMRTVETDEKDEWAQLERFAHAIADLRDQQWQEMLAKQEPYGWVSQHTVKRPYEWQFSKTRAGIYPDTAISIVPVFTRPALDQAAVMQQVYEVMGLMGADLICEVAHHAKKDRHESGEPCPIQKRWHEAFATLKQAIGENK